VKDSFFIGPHAENAGFLRDIWQELLQRTLQHRRETFATDSDLPISAPGADQRQRVKAGIEEFFDILHKEVPTFSNRYLGHMVSDVSIPALVGNISVLFCNPNLASHETARAGVYFETRAINILADMIGLDREAARGHFTSGGTLANFEAFWRARYRMDHWLSMAAWLLEKGRTNKDIFHLAHQGWEDFYAHKVDHTVDNHDLRERSYVIRGPWDIAAYYSDILKRDFPQPVILVPGNKHYSWPKIANVFGISEHAIWSIDLDARGRISIDSLRNNIERAKREQRPIMMTVSVAGTTELGTVDPVDEVNDLLRYYHEEEGIHIWHHVDAAYGGYFCSTFRDGDSELNAESLRAFASLSRVDSVTLDPHKLGFVPYACGAFLVRDPRSYSVSHVDAPYLEEEPNVDYPTWSTTLEGSRSATGAGAVWLSSRVLPLDANGHGEILNQALRSKKLFVQKLQAQVPNIRLVPGSDTNIICFLVAHEGQGLRLANEHTERLVAGFQRSPNFAVTRTALSLKNYRALIADMVSQWRGETDDDHLLVVRMVIMSPYLADEATNERLMSEFIAELSAIEGLAIC
jgi:glutamate/tyrosine decarboxylase-like PLP-dependent enzyme